MPTSSLRKAANVFIRPPGAGDAAAFAALVRQSRGLHERWVSAPSTPAQFASYLRLFGGRVDTHRGFVVAQNVDRELVGVFNLSEIVRGVFCSAYLGYYAFAAGAGRGAMSEGLGLVLDTAFRDLRLHRVEANVQPANHRSLEFLSRAGFTREGYSRRYLKIGGRWRDHVRFALLAEDWRALRRPR
jgi:ribosomal-protein-alanine N-acetyltransferase